LANNEKKLWFAENGKGLKNKILDQVLKSPNDILLILNLNKIEVMDTSFARECIVKLIAEVKLSSPHPQIFLKNVNEYVKQNLHLSFKDHKVFTLITDNSNNWSLIGKFSEQNIDTAKALIKRKEASAKQIAKDLNNIGLSTAINRLNQLYDFCICTRKGLVQPTGGKEYLFSIQV
jgi:anti-anti-sigma regulatory factor